MEQWNPAKKERGGSSLYGSMLRQVKLAGGKVSGVLWYQGESDALGGAWKVYPKVFTDFIAAVRSDFGQPELPFYYVQIGRFVNGSDPKGWNAVQDAQRVLVDRVPNTAVVSVIDLELDDCIHVGTQGIKRPASGWPGSPSASCSGRLAQPPRPLTASSRVRTTRWSSNSKASTWAPLRRPEWLASR